MGVEIRSKAEAIADMEAIKELAERTILGISANGLVVVVGIGMAHSEGFTVVCGMKTQDIAWPVTEGVRNDLHAELTSEIAAARKRLEESV